jgi:predicted ATPase
MLRAVAVENYRSLRRLVVPLARLTLVTGPNGSGKSSLYRALNLLADTARGRLVASLAREGGLPSTMWAGPAEIGRAVRAGQQPVEGVRRTGPVQLRLGFSGDEVGYAVDLGLPVSKGSAFGLDPEIKRECVWTGPVLRPSRLTADRRGPALQVRDDAGDWHVAGSALAPFDSMMTAFADPRRAPDMALLRERMRGWRFHDNLRTDREAPARQPQVGTRSPALAHDGANLAAAIETIREIGDGGAFDEAVSDAFPGAQIEVVSAEGRFELHMRQHGLLRPLRATELSDGTLRYLLLVAALLTPRPPELAVFNEPEASLHPDLLPPLARLLAAAAAEGQMVVVTHSERLAGLLRDAPEAQTIRLEKSFGETRIADAGDLPGIRWEWPGR